MPDALSDAKAALAAANKFESGVEKKAPAAPHEFAHAPYAMATKERAKHSYADDVGAGLKWKKEQVDAVTPKE